MTATAKDLIARYIAGDQSVWIARNTAVYDTEHEFLGNDLMMVNAEELPDNVEWTQSEWLCVPYETLKFISQQFGNDWVNDVTTYTVVLRTDI